MIEGTARSVSALVLLAMVQFLRICDQQLGGGGGATPAGSVEAPASLIGVGAKALGTSRADQLSVPNFGASVANSNFDRSAVPCAV